MRGLHSLATLRFGSQLYGTATASSDIDLKSLHLPAGEDILLQRPADVVQMGSKSSQTESGFWSGKPRPNTAHDTDHESYALSKFLAMLRDGDMNAIELLFVPPQHVIKGSPEWTMISAPEIRTRLIDRRCRGFVGYCQNQATRYGVRASRVDAITLMIQTIEAAAASHARGLKSRIADHLPMLTEAVETSDDIAIVDHTSGPRKDIPHISVCGRLAPANGSLEALLLICQSVQKRYGQRSQLAAENNGYDFRALAHAIRVAREAVELLTTGRITFPVQDPDEIRAIKAGRIDGPGVTKLLASLIEDVEVASANSVLAENVDEAFMEHLQIALYSQQISDCHENSK